jgi:hypothetical protein
MTARPNVRMLAQAATTRIWPSRSLMLIRDGQLFVVSCQLCVGSAQDISTRTPFN